jgi:hypothetical protein
VIDIWGRMREAYVDTDVVNHSATLCVNVYVCERTL